MLEICPESCCNSPANTITSPKVSASRATREPPYKSRTATFRCEMSWTVGLKRLTRRKMPRCWSNTAWFLRWKRASSSGSVPKTLVTWMPWMPSDIASTIWSESSRLWR